MRHETLNRREAKLNCFVSVVFLFFLFAVNASAGTLHQRQTITAPDGRVRYFHYYVPEKLVKKAPVVIVLHGGTQDNSSILREKSAQREWLKTADENGVLLIIPNGINPKTGDADGTNQQWNDCRADDASINTGADDVGFIRALIDWASSKFSIDQQRIYATGASNGGMMAYRLAYELSDRIAAVAAFIANIPEHSECKKPAKPISVFICNGTKDPLMPWGGGLVGRRGTVISADATRNYWINFDGTSKVPQSKNFPDINRKDGSIVKSELYTGGKNGTEVLFYTVEGGGHNVPSIDHISGRLIDWLLGKQNHDVEGVREAWKFLSRQRL